MSKRRSRRSSRRREVAELNITAFMNLMVVLTPFLLITAVFSRLAILELNLPAAQSQANPEQELAFQLEITVRESGIEVGDRNAGTLSRLEKTGEDYPLQQLSEYLARIKQQFPAKADATVLLEPDISYQVLVAVMDKVRVSERRDPASNQIVKAELFPEISIGDAPVPN
jgi:biopolymer transport protein ExbD